MEPTLPSDIRDEATDSMLEMGGKAAHLASFLLVAKLVAFVLAGATLIIVARILGPSTYGVYTLAIATAAAFGSFLDFGVGTALVKFIPEYLQKKNIGKISSLLSNSAIFLVVEGMAFTLVAILFSGVVAQSVLHNALYTHLLELAALTIIMNILASVGYSVLIGFGRGKLVAAAVTIAIVAQAVISISLALLGLGATAPVLGYLFGMVFSFIFSGAMILREKGVRLRWSYVSAKELKELVGFALPIGISSTLTTVMSNFALLFLGLYAVSALLGNIGITFKAASTFDVVLGSIALSLLPVYSVTLSSEKTKAKKHSDVGKYYNRSLYFGLLFASPLIMYVIVLAQPFITTIFGSSYAGAAPYVGLMGLSIFLSLAGNYTTNLLIGAGKVRKVLKYNAIVAVLELILLPLLVPTYIGFGFAAIVFIIVPALTSAFFLKGAVDTFGMRIEWQKLAKVLIASLVSAAFILPLSYYFGGNYIPLLIAAIIEQLLLYPLMVVLARAVDRKDIENIRSITKSVPVVSVVTRWLTDYTSLFLR